MAYEDVMASDDRGLYEWLTNVVRHFFFGRSPCSSNNFICFFFHFVQSKFGFSFVSGVPATLEATEKLSRRIGFIRETQCRFNEYSILIRIPRSHLFFPTDGTVWDFTSDLSNNDTSYTTLALGAHTDNISFVGCPLLRQTFRSSFFSLFSFPYVFVFSLSRLTPVVFNSSTSSSTTDQEAPHSSSTDSTPPPS